MKIDTHLCSVLKDLTQSDQAEQRKLLQRISMDYIVGTGFL